MSPTPIFALDVVLPPKADQLQTIHDFLKSGRAFVDAEPDTIHWFGYRADAHADGSPAYFGIFDTFPSPEGRAAHLGGGLAKALLANASALLSGDPQIAPVDILGQQTAPKVLEGGELKAGVRVILKAKADKAGEVKRVFVEGAARAQQQPESGTAPYWSTFQKDDTTFGVVLAFFSDEDRKAHLGGRATELLTRLDGLLESPPVSSTFEIIASKI